MSQNASFNNGNSSKIQEIRNSINSSKGSLIAMSPSRNVINKKNFEY